MPNHVTSRLIVRGPWKELDRFREMFIGKDQEGEPFFDLDKAIPVPEDIKNVDHSSHGELAYQAWYGSVDAVKVVLGYSWVQEAGIKTRKQLQKFFNEKDPKNKAVADQYHRNLKKYGSMNAYDWHIANWGTKWNSYHFHWTTKHGPKDWAPTPTGEIEFTFDTAWSPPEPVLDVVAERFPELEIEVYSYDEGGNFACHGTYMEGFGALECGDATDELYEKVYGEPPTPPDAEEDTPEDVPEAAT